MTDSPKAGFLCAGRNPLDLSVSVHCSHKLMEALKNAGFATGSCYTEITAPDSPDKIRRAAKTLEHLCLANDLVITVGCTGFSAHDIIPDITDAVCSGKASYFANVLCGSAGIAAAEGTGLAGSENACRIFPDNDEYKPYEHGVRKRTDGTLSSRLDSAIRGLSEKLSGMQFPENCEKEELSYGSVMKIMYSSERRRMARNGRYKGKEFCFSADELNQDIKPCVKLMPSRATAGINRKALVLNLSNDAKSSVDAVNALIPALAFAVYNISGKSAAFSLGYEKSLKSSEEFQKIFGNRNIVNT